MMRPARRETTRPDEGSGSTVDGVIRVTGSERQMRP
jgi:hypothetical protein